MSQMPMSNVFARYKSSKFAHIWTVLLLDMAISLVASLFAIFAVRFFSDPFGSLKHFVAIWVAASALASLAAFFICGTYKIVIRHSTYRSIGQLTLATLVKEAILAVLIVAGAFKSFGLYVTRIEYMVVMMDALLTLMSLVVVRMIIIIAFQNISNDNLEDKVGRLGVLVYGTSNKSVAMLTRLEFSSHYNVLGFVSHTVAKAGQVIQDHKVYVVNSEDELERLKQKLGVQCVLFAIDMDAVTEKDNLVAMCINQGIHILNSPKIDDVTFGGMSQHAIQEVSKRTDDYILDGMSDFERITKRFVDFSLSSILILIFSPLFLICYIAIKLEDKGPAIYKQERIGRFGRPFMIYKLRSMRTDAESFGPALYAGDDDPRLTKVGGFLRRHHLDELPQLFNVFKGDMAFVGYRPERKFYIDQIMELDPRYYYLYQIRPGVTSYATLYNGYTDNMEKMLKRLEYDLYYLRHRSWWFDIKVLGMTFMSIVFGKKF